MENSINKKKYSILYLVAGITLIMGNVSQEYANLFFAGIIVASFLIQKGYIFRMGIYSFVAPYFILLGFSVWKYVFPYHIGIILALLLGELFGRILYNVSIKFKDSPWQFAILPILFYIFDFSFQKLYFLNYVNMPPILAPVYRNKFIINLVSIFGAQLTMLIFFITISSFIGILVHKQVVKHKALIFLAGLVIILLSNLLANYRGDNGEEKKATVAVVQGSFIVENPSHSYEEIIKAKLNHYIDLAKGCEADIIVFPETEFGLYDVNNIVDEIYRDNLMEVNEKTGGISVLTVTEGNSKTKSKDDRYFSALLIEDGEIIGISRKRNLVPFSETRKYSKGKDYNVFDTSVGKIGVSICYDMKTNTVAKLKSNGAELILAPFNNSSFGNAYHNISAYFSVVQAAEYKIPIAVSSEDGISMHIDRNGQIINELGYKDIGCISYEYSLTDTKSLYMYSGKYIEWIMYLFAIVFLSKSIMAGQN